MEQLPGRDAHAHDAARDVRELAICRVAVLNGAWYEWAHHAPLAVAGGVPEAAMGVMGGQEGPLAVGNKAEEFNDAQWATLVYADEMTRNVEVKEETFAELKKHFSDQEVVEITGTVRSGLSSLPPSPPPLSHTHTLSLSLSSPHKCLKVEKKY